MEETTLFLSDSLYQGNVKNGKPHGYGYREYRNGTIEYGLFENGNIIQGIKYEYCYNEEDNMFYSKVYYGQFRYGLPHGYGRLEHMDKLFRGQFAFGKKAEGNYYDY